MKRIALIIAAGMLLSVTGCLDYEETLTLNADGSGHVKMHFALDKTFLEDLGEVPQPGEGQADDGPLCTEDEMRAALEQMNSGLELIAYKETEDDKSVSWDLELTFSDYDDFRDFQSACPNDAMPTDDDMQFTYEEQPDGTWLFSRAFQGQGTSDESMMPGDEMTEEEYAAMMEEMESETDSADAAEPEESGEPAVDDDADEALDSTMTAFEESMQKLAEGMQRMEEDAKNHKIRLVVNVPGDIVESNATKVEGRTLTWEYTLDKIEAAPETLTATVRP